jgi:hypothetical protein
MDWHKTVFLIPVLLLAEPVFGEQDRTTPSGPPTVKLDRPRYAPLKDDQLRAAVSGYRITLDPDFIKLDSVAFDVLQLGGCPPTEVFRLDGNWSRGVCGVMWQETKGTWTVDGFELCVHVDKRDDECRRVWRASDDNRLIISIKFNETDEYNPYIRVPILAPKESDKP